MANNQCNIKTTIYTNSCTQDSNLNSWKVKNYNLLTAVIPTNSRPIPQPRNKIYNSETLPKYSLDITCDKSGPEGLQCNLLTINGGNIDINLGYIVYNFNSKKDNINHSDYLVDSRDTTKKISNDLTPFEANFCTTGWKSSRVYGNYNKTSQVYRLGTQPKYILNPQYCISGNVLSFNSTQITFIDNKISNTTTNSGKYKALARPIKHWRKQLFPRQYISEDGTPIYSKQLESNIFTGSNVPRGRKNISLNQFEFPGGYTITSTDSIINNNNNQISCIPILIPDNSNILQSSCQQLYNTVNYNDNICNTSLNIARGMGLNFQKSNYYNKSFKGYLQNTARLNYQINTIDLSNSNIYSNLFKNTSYNSLYKNNTPQYIDDNLSAVSCYTSTCKCNSVVTFKPKNYIFFRNSAVSSGNNIRRKSRVANTRNQYNLINKFGIISTSDSLKTAWHNYRVTLNGTYKCSN